MSIAGCGSGSPRRLQEARRACRTPLLGVQCSAASTAGVGVRGHSFTHSPNSGELLGPASSHWRHSGHVDAPETPPSLCLPGSGPSGQHREVPRARSRPDASRPLYFSSSITEHIDFATPIQQPAMEPLCDGRLPTSMHTLDHLQGVSNRASLHYTGESQLTEVSTPAPAPCEGPGCCWLSLFSQALRDSLVLGGAASSGSSLSPVRGQPATCCPL